MALLACETTPPRNVRKIPRTRSIKASSKTHSTNLHAAPNSGNYSSSSVTGPSSRLSDLMRRLKNKPGKAQDYVMGNIINRSRLMLNSILSGRNGDGMTFSQMLQFFSNGNPSLRQLTAEAPPPRRKRKPSTKKQNVYISTFNYEKAPPENCNEISRTVVEVSSPKPPVEKQVSSKTIVDLSTSTVSVVISEPPPQPEPEQPKRRKHRLAATSYLRVKGSKNCRLTSSRLRRRRHIPIDINRDESSSCDSDEDVCLRGGKSYNVHGTVSPGVMDRIKKLYNKTSRTLGLKQATTPARFSSGQESPRLPINKIVWKSEEGHRKKSSTTTKPVLRTCESTENLQPNYSRRVSQVSKYFPKTIEAVVKDSAEDQPFKGGKGSGSSLLTSSSSSGDDMQQVISFRRWQRNIKEQRRNYRNPHDEERRDRASPPHILPSPRLHTLMSRPTLIHNNKKHKVSKSSPGVD